MLSCVVVDYYEDCEESESQQESNSTECLPQVDDDSYTGSHSRHSRTSDQPSQQLPAPKISTQKVRRKLVVKLKDRLPKRTGGDRRFTCTICNRRYATTSSLRYHMNRHTDESEWPFQCDVCGRKFAESAHLDVHRWCHLSMTSSVSEEQFSQSSELKQHMISSGGNMSQVEHLFTCTVCKRKFDNFLNLQLHSKEHAPMSNFCAFCEKQFPCRDDLEVHACVRNFVCTLCNQTFINTCDLKNHMHVHRRDKTLTCRSCNKKFTYLSNAIRHMHIHNGTHSCGICGVQFSRKDDLREHRNLHIIHEQIPCDVSSQNPTLPAPMQQAQSRKDQGPRCEICSDRFPTKEELKMHVLSHRDAKSYTCVYCNQSFASRYKLRAHVRIHTPQEVITCYRCNREFTHRGNFVRHMQCHSGTQSLSTPEGRRQYICDICGKHFLHLSKFESHRRIHLNRREDNSSEMVTEGIQEQTASNDNDNQTLVADNGVKHTVTSSVGTNYTSSHKENQNQQHTQEDQILYSHDGSREQVNHNVSESQATSSRKRILQQGVEREIAGNIGENHTIDSKELASHEEIRTCSICGETFADISELEAHWHEHRHEKTFPCHLCNHQLKHCNNFIRHMKKHIGKQPFSCGICGKMSYRSDLITSHMRSHVAEKQSAVLTENIPTSSGPEPKKQSLEKPSSIICDICGKRFIHLTTYEVHRRGHYEQQQMATNAGNKQASSCTTDNGIQQPINSSATEMLGSQEHDFTCSVCGEAFAEFGELESHLRVHRREKTFACNVCDKEIARVNNFIRHMRLHFCAPEFSCGICGMRSYHACDMKKHMRIHTGERPYSCDRCDKKFITSSSLRSHQHTHRE